MMIPCQCYAIPALAPGKDSGSPDSESDDSAARQASYRLRGASESSESSESSPGRAALPLRGGGGGGSGSGKRGGGGGVRGNARSDLFVAGPPPPALQPLLFKFLLPPVGPACTTTRIPGSRPADIRVHT
jgi:hypothetical protein